LLQAGANPNITDNDGETALMGAAKGGFDGIIELLINAGASLSAQDRLGRTALHWAAVRGDYPQAVSALVKADADLNLTQFEGWTPLMCAAAMEHPMTVAVLLDAQAKLDVEGHSGETAITLAIERGYQQIVDMLRQRQPST
jgi:ankyrin repeat protein